MCSTLIWTFLRDNLGNVSDEHGERFHQYISLIEKGFEGKWNTGKLADYCWNLTKDDENLHQRVKRTNVVKTGEFGVFSK